METTRWQDIDTDTMDGLRELDKEIARRRGFKIVVIKGGHYLTENSNADNPLERFGNLEYYTTDANAALSLLENTKDQWVISADFRPEIGPHYHVSKYLGSAGWHVGNANTLALAICLAWLVFTDKDANS